MLEEGDSGLEREGSVEHMSFDVGFEAAVARIEDLLRQQDLVVVAIQGSGVNVGKSTLLFSLEHHIRGKSIPTATSELDDFGLTNALALLAHYRHFFAAKSGVILMEHLGLAIAMPQQLIDRYKTGINSKLRGILETKNIAHGQVDLWLSIYRPDRPFPGPNAQSRPMGDIIICNEKAKDKRID